MKNTFIKSTLSIFAGTLVLLSCSNLTGNDFKDTEATASEFEQFATPGQIRGIEDLLPDGMSIEDVTPTRFFTREQRNMFMSSMVNSSEDSYSLELLPVPERTNVSVITGFNENGAVLYTALEYGFRTDLYYMNSSKDTLAIFNGEERNETPVAVLNSGDLNDHNEVVFFTESSIPRENGSEFRNTSYSWSEFGGLNEIKFNQQTVPFSYLNNITNNSTIFGPGSTFDENGNRAPTNIFKADISGNAIDYSASVGHDVLSYPLFTRQSLVANDLDQVAFLTENREEFNQPSDKLVGFISPSGNLEYYTVTWEEIANGVPFMLFLADMNDDAQIVGQSRIVGQSSFLEEPAIWQGGITTLLPYPDEYRFVRATSVNNSGYIVGYGSNIITGRFDILLWTPDLQLKKIETDNTELSAILPFINDQNEIAVSIVIEENGVLNALPAKLTKRSGDTTPPVISSTQEIISLWPVDHKMKLTISGITATDDQDPDPLVEVNVSSSETMNGTGDGNTESDWEIIQNSDGSYDVYLRAERSGKGNGRTYTVEITATDASGNTASESITVTVEHDQSGFIKN